MSRGEKTNRGLLPKTSPALEVERAVRRLAAW